MGLDILELVVHETLDVRGCGHVLAEKGRVFFICVIFNLTHYASALCDVSLEFAARLDAVSSEGKRQPSYTYMLIQLEHRHGTSSSDDGFLQVGLSA